MPSSAAVWTRRAAQAPVNMDIMVLAAPGSMPAFDRGFTCLISPDRIRSLRITIPEPCAYPASSACTDRDRSRQWGWSIYAVNGMGGVRNLRADSCRSLATLRGRPSRVARPAMGQLLPDHDPAMIGWNA